MISSTQDYLFYLEADKIALGKKSKNPRMFGDEVWLYQILLRKEEYLYNCKINNYIWKLYYFWIKLKRHYLGMLLGFTVPINVFGAGLSIAHHGGLIVNPSAKVGVNCRIHGFVNIGTQAGFSDKSPTIGDNVYIGPGAKLTGAITLADNIAIGANAVVNKSFLQPSVTIAGAPARIVSEKGSLGLTINATEQVINFMGETC